MSACHQSRPERVSSGVSKSGDVSQELLIHNAKNRRPRAAEIEATVSAADGGDVNFAIPAERIATELGFELSLAANDDYRVKVVDRRVGPRDAPHGMGLTILVRRSNPAG